MHITHINETLLLNHNNNKKPDMTTNTNSYITHKNNEQNTNSYITQYKNNEQNNKLMTDNLMKMQNSPLDMIQQNLLK